ncbi:MAG: excalibur calcium-binding domain-containing protein [Candidatus Pelagibacterales bacterium]
MYLQSLNTFHDNKFLYLDRNKDGIPCETICNN